MPDRRRAAVIVNPVSGPRRTWGEAARRVALARAVLERAGVEAEIAVTEGRGHARELAAAHARAGVPLVIVWGGDGTANEAAQALVFSDTALALVPSGSGNGFATELGIPRDASAALCAALAWAPRRIDAGRLGGRLFVNIGGAGFDALVARRFQAHGRRGALPYLTIGLRAGLTYQPRRYRVELDGTVLEGRALLVACANGRQYGNGAVIAPRACFADGLLDVVFVDSRPFLVDLVRVPFLFLRRADRIFGVRTHRARRLAIEADAPVDLHVDGEPLEPARRVEVEVLAGALAVVAGPGALRTSAGTVRGSARRS